VPQNGIQNVMPVGKDVSRYLDAFLNRTLDGKTSAIDLWLDVFDYDPSGKRGFWGAIFCLGRWSAGQFAAWGFAARDG